MEERKDVNIEVPTARLEIKAEDPEERKDVNIEVPTATADASEKV